MDRIGKIYQFIWILIVRTFYFTCLSFALYFMAKLVLFVIEV